MGDLQRQSIHDAIVRRTGYSRCHGGKVCCPDDKIALLKNPQPEDFARSGGEGRYGRIAARSPKIGHSDRGSLSVLQLFLLVSFQLDNNLKVFFNEIFIIFLISHDLLVFLIIFYAFLYLLQD